jgi:hypothetical protein
MQQNIFSLSSPTNTNLFTFQPMTREFTVVFNAYPLGLELDTTTSASGAGKVVVKHCSSNHHYKEVTWTLAGEGEGGKGDGEGKERYHAGTTL